MSRSKRKRRHPGAEYWSRRPLSNRCGAWPGRETKTLTHRLERRLGDRELEHELDETHDEAQAPKEEEEG
jgi:pyridoxine/pyridoxamine 5'-phosphate oxidase